MVSARPLVVLGLTAFLALASPRARADAPDDAANSRVAASSPSQVSPAPVPIEDRPYKIRAWVSLDPRCRLDYRGRAELIAGWQTLITRFVGLPWDVEVAEGPGPLRGGELKDLTAEMIGPEAKGFDKAWAFTIGPIEGGYGVTLSGREFDAATGQVGLVGTRAVPSTADAPRGLLMLALELFAPTAEISKKVGGGADIKVHGSMLPAADPVGRVVQIGSVFKIARVAYRPDGSVAKILPIPRTYLRVDAIDGATTHCDIITKLRDPLTRLVVGQTKIVAVGVKPSALPTRLQFLSRPPERRPLAGYTVTARPAPDGPARVVAVTDRDGRVVLPPYFDNRLVILRLVAADLEPLDEFPIMPGETEELRTIANVDPKRDAVTLETDLIALRDELIDQWSVRARLDALILPRVQQEAWDEVRLLLEEYDKLRKQDYYKGRLEALQQAAAARQQEIRKPVLTRTAQRLAAENSAVIESYIDDELFASYADAYDRYAATAPPEKARRKTLPSGRPEDDLAGLSTPSASGAGLEETRAGLAESRPSGETVRVAFPGAPERTVEAVEGDDEGEIRRYEYEDPAKGRYFWSVFVPVDTIRGTEAKKRALDTGRREAMAAAKGSKLLAERELTLEDEYPGREIEIEWRPEPDAPKHIARVRTYLVGNRVYTVGVSGTEAQVRTRAAELALDSFRLTEAPAPDELPAEEAAAPAPEPSP